LRQHPCPEAPPGRCDGPARPEVGRDEVIPVRGVGVSDVVFVVLTVALFAALALVVRAVEKQ
jgi:hypothetical protein